MATIAKGILGPVRGTIGTITGSSWRGINYIRSRIAKRKNNPTPAQAEQQARFSLMAGFMQSVKPLVALGFQGYANLKTAVNSALSYNLKNGIAGSFPDFTIQYNMILVSRGDLLMAGVPAAAPATAGKIAFSWTDNSGTGKAKASDIAILAAHCPENNQTIFAMEGATRADGTAELDVPEFSGKAVETYLFFVSANGKETATSVHTGHLVVV